MTELIGFILGSSITLFFISRLEVAIARRQSKRVIELLQDSSTHHLRIMLVKLSTRLIENPGRVIHKLSEDGKKGEEEATTDLINQFRNNKAKIDFDALSQAYDSISDPLRIMTTEISYQSANLLTAVPEVNQALLDFSNAKWHFDHALDVEQIEHSHISTMGSLTGKFEIFLEKLYSLQIALNTA